MTQYKTPNTSQNTSIQRGEIIQNSGYDIPHFYQSLLPDYYHIKSALENENFSDAASPTESIISAVNTFLERTLDPYTKEELTTLQTALTNLRQALNQQDLEKAKHAFTKIRTIEITVLEDNS